jgi:hypothetical protein
MYEIPFISKDILDQCDNHRAESQSARMVELVAVADKLMKADWPIEWTITGLAFDLPYKIKYGPEQERTPAAIRKQLLAMAIQDEFRMQSSRSLLEVVAAKSEYADRVRYADADHYVRIAADGDCPTWEDERYIRESLVEQLEMEARYGRKDLLVDGDYQRGTVRGRREALDWLFGADWPALEPADECEAECMEEERAYVRQEEAIEGLHTVLFGEQEVPAAEPAQPDPKPVTQSSNASVPRKDSGKIAEAMDRLAVARANGQQQGEPSVN